MKIFTIRDALISLYKDAQWILCGDEIEWHSEDIVQPTQQELEDEVQRLQSDYDNKEYQRLRAKEYPAIADQLDYIYHNGIDAWKTDMIDPVKTKYPKGTT
jgi:hypothetical protein